jgi:hypothetical protein
MIPVLSELARNLPVSPAFLPLVLAAALTGIILLVPTILRWFEDGKS